MVVKFAKRKLCIAIAMSTISLSLTGCKSSNNYESILAENQFEYEIDDNNFLVLIDSNICDEDVTSLSDEIVALGLYRCNYLTNLDDLPSTCPNIRNLCIDKCASFEDFSFVYNMPNLKRLDVIESAFVTRELVDYLDTANISHNITDKDIYFSEMIDEILSKIITDEMNDTEKINAIACYLMDEYSYVYNTASKSNLFPLSSFLETKKGVCASYAYLANALIRKAHINSYEITSIDHGWNILELDGKYYYLDSTNLKVIPFLSEVLIEKFGIGFYYLSDPEFTFWSAMKSYDDIENVIIPNSLIVDIINSEDEKSIIEKYKNTVPVVMIQALIILYAFMAMISNALNFVSKKGRDIREKEENVNLTK